MFERAKSVQSNTMVKRVAFYIYETGRINTSNEIFEGIVNVSEYLSFQKGARTAMIVIYCCIVILGILGNLLVILTILCEKHMRRKATYIFIFSLAIADVSFLVISLPFFAVAPVLNTWPFGESWCKFVYYFEHVNGTNSVFTLVALSADRLYGTLWPIKAKQIRTQKYAVCICTVIWMIVALVSISSISLYSTLTIRTLDNTTVTFCLLDAEDKLIKIKTTCLFVFGYIIPVCILVVIYYIILSHLKVQRYLRTYGSKDGNVIRWRQRKKVATLAITLVATFVVCWFPFHVHSFIRDVVETPLSISLACLYIFSYCLMYMHSCVNPILYAFISDDFRKGFSKRFCLHKFRKDSTNYTD